MILNIIHPHHYLLSSDGVQEPSTEKDGRDGGADALVNRALDNDHRVILHQMLNGEGFPAYQTLEGNLSSDALPPSFYDPRIEKIVTNHCGEPFPDQLPEGCSQADGELWQECVTTRQKLLQILGETGPLILIGGKIEASLTNFALYLRENGFRTLAEPIYYVPALSVCLNQEHANGLQMALNLNNIVPLSIRKAFQQLEK